MAQTVFTELSVESKEISVYWMTFIGVLVTQVRHGYRHLYPLPRVWIHGHPVAGAGNERPVSVGPRLRGWVY